MKTLAEVGRESERHRAKRLRELSDPECQRCHGHGRSDSNYISPGKYGELICPCTGAAPWQDPDRINHLEIHPRRELDPASKEQPNAD